MKSSSDAKRRRIVGIVIVLLVLAAAAAGILFAGRNGSQEKPEETVTAGQKEWSPDGTDADAVPAPAQNDGTSGGASEPENEEPTPELPESADSDDDGWTPLA